MPLSKDPIKDREGRRKMSESLKGHRYSKERNEKISKTLKGRPHTEESNRKLSIAKTKDESKVRVWLGVRYRLDNDNRYRRQGKWIRLSYDVWNYVHPNNPVEKGEVVHHRDGNSLNDHPNNLGKMQSQGEHAKWHQKLIRHKKLGYKPRTVIFLEEFSDPIFDVLKA